MYGPYFFLYPGFSQSPPLFFPPSSLLKPLNPSSSSSLSPSSFVLGGWKNYSPNKLCRFSRTNQAEPKIELLLLLLRCRPCRCGSGGGIRPNLLLGDRSYMCLIPFYPSQTWLESVYSSCKVLQLIWLYLLKKKT